MLKRPSFIALSVLPSHRVVSHRVVVAVVVVALGTRKVVRGTDTNKIVQGVHATAPDTKIAAHHLIALRNTLRTNVLDSVVHFKDILAVTATVAGDAL